MFGGPPASRARRRACAVAGGVVLALLATTLPRAATSVPPVFSAVHGDFPDPHVLRHGTTHYAYSTNDWDNVPVLRSSNLRRWERVGDALPELGSWAKERNTWAPSVIPVAGRFVLFYSAPEKASGLHCIGRAVGSHPAGPFVDHWGAPLVCQRDLRGSIDPSGFIDADGSPWLLWKSEGRPDGEVTRIWSSRLDSSGTWLTGTTRVILSQALDWEHPVIENPTMLRVDGRHHLFYSANLWFTDRYAIGRAVCDSPAGPCHRSASPFLSSRGAIAGPGGPAVFNDRYGNPQMAFHAWDAGRVGYENGGERKLRVEPLTFMGGHPALHPRPVAVAANPRGGHYVLTADGRVRPQGGAAGYGSPRFDFPIARDLAVMPDGRGYIVLDGWGGLHKYGSARSGTMAHLAGTYWPGWDIARRLEITASGAGLLILDGWGGIHARGDAPRLSGRYWPGWDIARGLTLTPDGGGGYLLDGWGGVHALGTARYRGAPYWPGWDIARDIVATSSKGYAVLDGLGGIHPFGDAPKPNGGTWGDRWWGLAFDGKGYRAVRSDSRVFRG